MKSALYMVPIPNLGSDSISFLHPSPLDRGVLPSHCTYTWIDMARLDQLQRNINFEHKCFVEQSTQGGGLVLFRKSTVNLSVEDSSKYYIDALINKNY